MPLKNPKVIRATGIETNILDPAGWDTAGAWLTVFTFTRDAIIRIVAIGISVVAISDNIEFRVIPIDYFGAPTNEILHDHADAVEQSAGFPNWFRFSNYGSFINLGLMNDNFQDCDDVQCKVRAGSIFQIRNATALTETRYVLIYDQEDSLVGALV